MSGAAAQKNLVIGIAAGMFAGVLWGLVFLAPQVLGDFTPFEIAFGRFFFFALVSCLSLRRIGHFIRRLPTREIMLVVALSAAGFWVYTIALAWSVQHSGGILTTLVIGLLPITISLVGRGVRGLQKQFVAGLILLVAGLAMLTVVPWGLGFASVNFSFAGIIILLAALAMWTWYALANTEFVKRHKEVSKADLISLFGLLSFFCLLIVSPFVIDTGHLLHHPQAIAFWLFSAVLGIGSTWLAYWLWSVCSAYCPPTISGPLIVSETVCGLLFTFLYQGRLPAWYETATIILFIIGSVLCIRSEMKAEPVAL